MTPTASPSRRRPDNWLRAVPFETPDHVPVACNSNTSCWHHFDRRFLWEMKTHAYH